MTASDNAPTYQGDEGDVTIYRAASRIDAEMVRGSLNAAGIPAEIGEQLTEWHGTHLTLSQGGWGVVKVPARFVADARAALAAADEGQGRVSDEDLESAAMDSFDPRV